MSLGGDPADRAVLKVEFTGIVNVPKSNHHEVELVVRGVRVVRDEVAIVDLVEHT